MVSTIFFEVIAFIKFINGQQKTIEELTVIVFSLNGNERYKRPGPGSNLLNIEKQRKKYFGFFV